MSYFVLLSTLLLLTCLGFVYGRKRSLSQARGNIHMLHSLPNYYGMFVALWCLAPSAIIFLAWVFLEPQVADVLLREQLAAAQSGQVSDGQMSLYVNEVRNIARGIIAGGQPDPVLVSAAEYYTSLRQTGFAALAVAVLSVAMVAGVVASRMVDVDYRARNAVEKIARIFMVACSAVAILTTLGIVLSVLFESARFFAQVPFTEFLFGLQWSPQIALRTDQVGSSGAFGAVPLFAGTMLITFIAMIVAVPIGLFSAIYLSEYASEKVRAVVKPLLEILAGIPTVVYGFFAALTVAPAVRGFGESIGLDVSSESALAAGMVMGIMIIPFVSSLSDDVINAVPQSLRDGSYAMGATTAETVRQVIVPAALPGIVGGVLLAVSRGIGETMIVVMAAGLAANLTANPLEAVTTVTVQIVTLLVGDQEFDSAKTLAAFALALVLFAVTLCLNVVALATVRKYREKYD
jgi:phosphate transport system permease protein